MRTRASVNRFAELMEAELRENDHKGGWKDCEPGWLLRRAGQELDELRRSYAAGEPSQVIKSEAADVANFLMMLTENYKRTPSSGGSRP